MWPVSSSARRSNPASRAGSSGRFPASLQHQLWPQGASFLECDKGGYRQDCASLYLFVGCLVLDWKVH